MLSLTILTVVYGGMDYMDNSYISIAAKKCIENSTIDTALFSKYDVQKGLRDKNGVGVLAGLTNISSVIASKEVN